MIVVNLATGRDARAVTPSMVEQYRREGQQRVHRITGRRDAVEMDVSFAQTEPDALKELARALLLYRLPPEPCPEPTRERSAEMLRSK